MAWSKLDYLSKKDYVNLLLGVSVFLIMLGGFRFLTARKDSTLVMMKGILLSAENHITRKSYQIKGTTHYYNCSEVVFTITGGNYRQYRLSKDIGDHFNYLEHDAIVWSLKRSDTIMVWVKSREAHQFEPEVYLVKNSANKTIVPQRNPDTDTTTPLIMFGCGLLGLGAYIVIKRSKKD
jgi:hypothetical protein